MRTLRKIRTSFWDKYPEFVHEYHPDRRHAEYPIDIRLAFSDWIDYLHEAGQISETLADKAAL